MDYRMYHVNRTSDVMGQLHFLVWAIPRVFAFVFCGVHDWYMNQWCGRSNLMCTSLVMKLKLCGTRTTGIHRVSNLITALNCWPTQGLTARFIQLPCFFVFFCLFVLIIRFVSKSSILRHLTTSLAGKRLPHPSSLNAMHKFSQGENHVTFHS